MIVSMKKTTLLCLKKDKEANLEKLRDLGVFHVEMLKRVDSGNRVELEQILTRIQKTLAYLGEIKEPVESKAFAALDGKELFARADALVEENGAYAKRRQNLLRDRERALPWGDFSPSLIDDLAKRGVHVYLCAGVDDDVERLPEGAVAEIVGGDKKTRYFAVVSKTELDPATLPLAPVPKDASLSEVEREIDSCAAAAAANEGVLAEIAARVDAIVDYQNETLRELEFVTNRDGMDESGEFAYLGGYVPKPQVEGLRQAARNNGWALLIKDPTADDKPPTLIKTPKIFDIAKPIFNFIGIAPGYREWDVSTVFLFFFTIFFGMIVGDAGYGFLFLATSLAAKFFLRRKKFQRTINLFLTLSAATIIWGALTCTWFGLAIDNFPKWMRGLHWLTDPEIKNKNIQYLCFVLAAVHLSLARTWKGILAINNFKCLGEFGWALLIWGNFFTAVELIVFQGSFPQFAYYLYGVGFVLVLLFSLNWKDVGDIFNFPFGLIGSFVDLLSYIRLFAVGLATYYIANSFNQMGLMVMDVSASKLAIPFLFIGCVLVILFGHVLNIGLALIAVLVHGIRLNTLEFSNHMGLQWLGFNYAPFKKNDEDEKETS